MHSQVMPLCTSERVSTRYATLNRATFKQSDGSELHLYARLTPPPPLNTPDQAESPLISPDLP